MGKTLRAFSYRGVNVYIRSLGMRWYEVLVPFHGVIHAVQLNTLKPRPHEQRASRAERDEGALNELSQAGIQLIDNLFLDHPIEATIQKVVSATKLFIKQTYGKLTTKIKRPLGNSPSVPLVEQEQG